MPLACSSASPKVQETKRAVVTRLGSVLILAPPHPPDTERHGAPLSALCAPVVSVYCLSFSFAEKSSLLSPRDYHIALSGGPRSWSQPRLTTGGRTRRLRGGKGSRTGSPRVEPVRPSSRPPCVSPSPCNPWRSGRGLGSRSGPLGWTGRSWAGRSAFLH